MKLYLDNCIFNRPFDDQSNIKIPLEAEAKLKIQDQRGISMMTDTEIKAKGVQILAQYLGDIEMERFMALIQREPFDYTQWRQDIDADESIEDISRKAMELRNNKPKPA